MKRYFIVVGLILFSGSLFPSVWLSNGNFSLSFTDVNEGNNLVFNRYYNSLGPSKGLFGYGWGSQMEGHLYIVAGPLVMIEEAPSGGRSHYIDKKNDTLSSIADKLLKLSNSMSNGKEYYNKLKENLLRDATLLYEHARRHNFTGKVAEGTVLECLERPDEKIKRTSNGYIRYRSDGGIDEFDNNGRIIKKTFTEGRFLSFSYDGNGALQTIRDSLGRSMRLYVNGKGFLDKVVLYNSKVASYSYDDLGNLVESTDTNGKNYKYKYDSYHRLIELTLMDSADKKPSKWLVSYDTNTGKAIYQKTPDGWETFTEYTSDKSKSDYYDTVSVIKRYANEVISEKYEMWRRPKPDGSLYVYKTREKIGNKVKTSTLTMCCSTPLVVNDNGKITRYEYNEKGRLKKKVSSNGRILSITYDDKDRVTSIINNGSPYKFKYNEKSQMVFAANNVVKFKMDYNGNGDLSNIYDDKGNKFDIKYDEFARINEISTKYGSMLLTYDRDGNPVKMDTKGMTMDKFANVQKAYQDYLDLMSVFKLINPDA